MTSVRAPRLVRAMALVLSLMCAVMFTSLAPAQATVTDTTITGTISSDPGADLDGVPVELQSSDDGFATSENLVGSTTDGEFEFQQVEIDSALQYRLVFASSGSGSAFLPMEKAITILEGDNTFSAGDTYLTVGGSITGTVTNTADPAAGLEGIRVEAYDAADHYASATTNEDGEFSLKGLPTGDYRVYFYNDDDYVYIEKFWDNASYDDTELVHVVEGASSPLSSVVLTRSALVSGTVTAATGGGIEAGVIVQTSNGDYVTGTTTEADGFYELRDLEPGTYNLYFFDNRDVPFASQLVGEFFDNSQTREGATPIVVVEGVPITGKNAALSAPAPVVIPPVVIPPKYASSVSGSVKGGKKKATFKAKIRFANLKAKKTKGTLYVYEGARVVKKAKFKKGKASFKVKAKKGIHTYTVVFNGGANYGTKTFTRTVKVK